MCLCKLNVLLGLSNNLVSLAQQVVPDDNVTAVSYFLKNTSLLFCLLPYTLMTYCIAETLNKQKLLTEYIKVELVVLES